MCIDICAATKGAQCNVNSEPFGICIYEYMYIYIHGIYS